MPALVAGIYVFTLVEFFKTWMPGQLCEDTLRVFDRA